MVSNQDHQQRVNSHFDSASSYWAEIYTARSVEGAIYQHRKALVLRWIDELGLPQGSKVLEVGCGAGLMTIELARRGYVVDGVDSSEAMVERALQNAARSDVEDRINVFRGDVRSLPFEENSFNLVLAIGVIPWLDSPGVAVSEMARVARPGGYAILTSDNRARLNYLIDPKCNPTLGPLRQFLKRVLEDTGLREPHSDSLRANLHTTSYIDRIIYQNHLEKIKAATVGFGPFSFLGRTLLSEAAGIRLHSRLQALADRGVAGIRSTGSQYLILARKPLETPAAEDGSLPVT